MAGSNGNLFEGLGDDAPQGTPEVAQPQAGLDGGQVAVPATPPESLEQRVGQFAPPQPGISVGGTLKDIGVGITELPRAAVKGARNAVQNTLQAVGDLTEQSRMADAMRHREYLRSKGLSEEDIAAILPGLKPQGKIEELPNLAAPTSNTGQFATSVFQFATGMLVAGQLTAPIKAAGAAKVALEVGKSAAVGSIAFDPSDKRMADLVESIPGLSNPVSRWLASSPSDSRAMGRLKNAIESVGFDLAVVLPLQAALRMFKARRDVAAGVAGPEEVLKATAEAEALLKKASKAQAGPVRDMLDLSTPPKGAKKKFTPAQAADGAEARILAGMRSDEFAINNYGSWQDALDNGHFADPSDLNIPWQKLGTDQTQLGALTSRIASEIERSTTAARGGGVDGILSDPAVKGMVTRRASLWNEDPAELMAILQQAGKNSKNMAANMEASYLVATRAFRDTYATAQRILAGNLDEWGGDPAAADKALRDMVSIVATAYNSAQAMRASAGRTMRRLRPEFQVMDEAVGKLQTADPRMLAQMIASTGGNPASIRKLANAGFADKSMDAAQWLLTNNLLWGPTTHAVNLTTNLYMAAARPLERIIGSAFVGGSEGAVMRREAQYQMAYYGSMLVDGWRSAAKAWRLGDSVMTPHTSEALNVGGNISTTVAQMPFKSPDGLSNVVHNAMAFSLKTVGLPTRALGTVDEMIRQVTYRSKVAATAHREALERGLDVPGVREYVKRAVDNAFDDAGRAINEKALEEAKVTVFQQDLLPRTFGHSVQAAATGWKPLRIVLPFIRTPINVMRYGWKMTPGLNVLQTEYRQMLTGAMGKEAQAQAIGQMSMGSLLMGTMAFFASEGLVTGGGPTDPVQRKRLMDTGWRPYSFVGHDEKGNKTFTQFGKFDPVAMPFGVVADLVEAWSIGDQYGEDLMDKVETGGTALLISLAKQMSNKSFLMSINQAVDAISDPDRSASKFGQQMAANFMPLASGLRFINPDPHLREARSVTDKLISQVPGLSETLPPRRDAFGEPVVAHKGTMSYSSTDIATRELQRMLEENGQAFGPPSHSVDNVDLREIITTKGENAYDLYQRLAAKPSAGAPSIKDSLMRIMSTPAYRKAPDGDADLKGTKLYILTGVISRYRAAARKAILADKNVREAMLERHREVSAAYASKKSATAPSTGGAKGLVAIGEAFGVDLTPIIAP